MGNVLGMDTVMQHARQSAQKFQVPSDTAITQQILLFGDAFFGYRFTALDFTAVWSAADQILKVFAPDGRMLEAFPIADSVNESIPLPLQRKVA